MRRSLTAALLITGIASVVVPAAAQAPPEGYRREVRLGLREFNEGRWEEARALFVSAHELFGDARSARGIGMASFELRDYVRAHDALDEALVSTLRPLDDEQRQQTEDLLEQTRTFLGRCLFVVHPVDATVTVDDEEAAPRLDGMVLLGVGEHVVRVTHADHEPLTRNVTIRGGEQRRIELDLESRAGEEPSMLSAEGPVSVSPALFTAGVVTLVAGAVVAVGEIVGIAWFVDRENELALCRGVSNDLECRNEGTLASEHEASVGTAVALGVTTAVVAGVGLTLLLLAGDDDDSESATLACAPSIGGMACAGRF